MRVISNEVLAVENGTDSAKIVTVFDYGEDKVCMKFQMEDGTILVNSSAARNWGLIHGRMCFGHSMQTTQMLCWIGQLRLQFPTMFLRKLESVFATSKRFNFCSHNLGRRAYGIRKRLQPYR